MPLPSGFGLCARRQSRFRDRDSCAEGGRGGLFVGSADERALRLVRRHETSEKCVLQILSQDARHAPSHDASRTKQTCSRVRAVRTGPRLSATHRICPNLLVRVLRLSRACIYLCARRDEERDVKERRSGVGGIYGRDAAFVNGGCFRELRVANKVRYAAH